MANSTYTHVAALPSAPPLPPSAVSRILGQFKREQLAGFIEVAISLLDVVDGDEDVEANGDEADGDFCEDDFTTFRAEGPGCPISDPSGQCDEDEISCSPGQCGGSSATSGNWRWAGPGCVVSDPDRDNHPPYA